MGISRETDVKVPVKHYLLGYYIKGTTAGARKQRLKSGQILEGSGAGR